ncbi:MAG: S41 family peptidase [Tidjanibacter sp.]|nr:S41 family peptidase [Tidjanibacter sp.]
MNGKKVWRKVGVCGAVAACVLLGAAAGSNTHNLGKTVEILVNMLRTINLFYVDDVPSEKIVNAAAEGMTKILDPYTDYIPAEEMDDFATMTTGKYGGVGSLIRLAGDYVEFTAPYKGSPADRAGIRPGDRIVEIDGKSAKGLTTQQVSDRLRGDAGTSVKVTIERFPSRERQTLKIERERIAIPGVPYYGMINDTVGYISHSEFTEGSSSDLLRAYESLKAQGMRSLVLDYRGNGGGILQEATSVLSFFLPEGAEVVSTRSANNPSADHTFKTENTPIDLEIPIVVLVDSSSASAAEIVAGALQDYDRAVLVGQRTFGKGLVQSSYPLGYDAMLKITTSKYYLPSGRCIQAIDYAAHNEDGSVAQVPDSLVSEFKTRAGRKVYDGGGVMPDVKMEPEYVSTFAVVTYAQGFVDDFIADYCARHYEELEGSVVPAKYRFSDEAYGEFVEFMKDKEVAWESAASRLWKEFRKAAEKERWEERMTEQMAHIEANITNTTEDNLWLYKQELQTIIENNIVVRYCYNEGGVEHSLQSDKELERAIEILSNNTEYQRILAEQDTARK